jgi:putative transposase
MPVTRIKGIEGPAIVFVTTKTVNWIPIFSIESAAYEVTMQLGETSQAMDASIVGYTIMPTHIHIILGLKEISHLSEFMQSFKSISSRRLKCLDLGMLKEPLWRTGKFRLWNRRFDDLIVYSQKQFKTKLDYIHNNPVRAGLVMESIDWKYSSARDWLIEETGLIKIDKKFTCFD